MRWRALGEARLEALDGLRREADFRDEDERGLVLLQHPGDGLEIDFGLAAAGDAVEQHGLAVRRRRQRGQDMGERNLLFVREGVAARWR